MPGRAVPDTPPCEAGALGRLKRAQTPAEGKLLVANHGLLVNSQGRVLVHARMYRSNIRRRL